MTVHMRLAVASIWLAFAGCKAVAVGLHQAGVVNAKEASAIAAAGNLVASLKPFGWEEEQAIGGAVALEAIARFGGLYPDDSLQRYVGTVGTAVAHLSDRPNIAYHFAVLASREPNAFAAPGGYVFVTVGLLRVIEDEAELAGVLGHEIAHISEKHALSVIRRARMLSGVAEVSAAYMDQNPKVFDALVTEATGLILERGLDKEKESDADRIGTDFASRVGFHPSGLRDFLEALARVHGKQKSKLFSTHPRPEDRIAELDRTLGKQYAADKGPRLPDRYRARTRIIAASSSTPPQ